MKKAGIFVLIIGLGLTLFTAVTFFTREKVADIGDLKITANKRHHLNWSPFFGVGVMVIGGAMILLLPKNKLTN